MGFSCSFLAAKGRSKAEILESLGWSDSGVAVEWPEGRDTFCADLPGGWIVVWSNDYDYVTKALLAAASNGGEAVGWRVEEHVMVSDAWGFRDGTEIWSIFYDCEKHQSGGLAASGELPAEFAGILEVARAEQAEKDDADYVYDVPADVAAALCGFRYDQLEFDWGAPAFTALRRLPSGGGRDTSKKESFFGKLFGGR